MRSDFHTNPAVRAGSSIDQADVARFDKLGQAWWDERGSMAQLHKINPVRITFIRDALVRHFGRTAGSDMPEAGRPLSGLRLLDIGCGGGLLSEPLARLGARVVGIDPGETNIAVARRHAESLGLAIDYRVETAEELAEQGVVFDGVIASEVVEHAVDPAGFVSTACSLVRPGGMLVMSTLNRTAKSFLLAIVGGEYLLRWLPRGTHSWSQFVRPDELAALTRRAGLKPLGTRGMIYNPLRDEWALGRDTDVNYLFAATRLEA